MSPPSEIDNAFVSYLKGLARRDDRAALAALRRGLGRPPGTAAEMHPYVMPFLKGGPWTWRHQCHYVLAALFALHAESTRAGNMGSTMRAIAGQTGSESIEQRFVALLKSHRDDLFGHLRHAVSLARGKGVPIYWERLMRDIQHWDDERAWVQREWSQGFWGTSEAAGRRSPQTSTTGD